ncbi:hypothetical protein QZH41_005891 [Actinostola sp. cb2023]|nr:hypothetical protein QZH41_005891 [Actinostola sp. cb2023]
MNRERISPATSAHFREQAEVFNGIATKEAIETAGHNALVIFYNGKPGSQLDDIQYQRDKEKLATRTTHIQHNNLPPTSAAANYHSYRVYAQILHWKGNDVDVEEWGWKVRDEQVIPVMMDMPPAPESLLQIVRCNCASGCSTMRCSCRNHILECSPACGQCKGSSCTNSSVLTEENDSDNE